MVGQGAGRVLAAAHRREVDQLWRPLACEDGFADTSTVPGWKILLAGPECLRLPSPKAKASWSLFMTLESSQTCAATSLKTFYPRNCLHSCCRQNPGSWGPAQR